MISEIVKKAILRVANVKCERSVCIVSTCRSLKEYGQHIGTYKCTRCQFIF